MGAYDGIKLSPEAQSLLELEAQIIYEVLAALQSCGYTAHCTDLPVCRTGLRPSRTDFNIISLQHSSGYAGWVILLLEDGCLTVTQRTALSKDYRVSLADPRLVETVVEAVERLICETPLEGTI